MNHKQIDYIRRHFELSKHNTDIRTEVIAGLVTFITMSYIIFVNPAILKEAGVPLHGAIVATCIATGLMSLTMGLYSNYPLALAPGMGLNAVVTYTIVKGMGETWQVAMGMIVIEGIIITLLVLTNLREKVMDSIPLSLKQAIGVGIGVFLAFIGLMEGGIVVDSPVTLVQLGDLTQRYTQVALIGLLITSALVARRIKGGILYGVLITATIAIFMGIAELPKGVLSIPTDFSTFFRFDLIGALKLSLAPVIFSLFMSDFFDTMGTVIAIGEEAGFLDKYGRLPRLKRILLVDSVAAVAGGALGTSSVTTYIESAAGVSEGGKTGLSSLVTGTLFFAALFFTPLVAIVAAGYKIEEGIYRYPITSPALIVVGFLMMSVISRINFKEYEEGIPAFFIILVIPFTYSISYGIGFGFISYSLIKILTGKWKDVSITMYFISILFAISFAIPWISALL